MLRLPNVTMISVETQCHELARLTIMDCLAQIEFGEVLIYTDDPLQLLVPGASMIKVPNWPHKDQYMSFFQFESCDPVKTDFVLFVEWDSGICDMTMWTDDWFQYDYLGACWWYRDKDGKPLPAPFNVGNGGFSLRSTRLQRFLKANRQKYPAISDNQMCREYGPQIIAEGGFKWAPIDVANDFAVEGFDRLDLPNNLLHFGYHSVINWPWILSRDELVRRTKLCAAHKYVCDYGRTAELLRAVPQLADWIKE